MLPIARSLVNLCTSELADLRPNSESHENKNTRFAGYNNWRTNVSLWVAYFFLLLVITLPYGLETRLIETIDYSGKISYFSPSNTIDDVITVFGHGDAATYAKAAKLIATGTFSGADT